MGPMIVRVSDSLGKIVAQLAGLLSRKVCVIGGVALTSDRVGRCSRALPPARHPLLSKKWPPDVIPPEPSARAV